MSHGITLVRVRDARVSEVEVTMSRLSPLTVRAATPGSGYSGL